MTSIRLTADRGTICRVDGVIYEKANDQPSVGAPDKTFTESDVANISAITFTYDDSGVNGGSNHRTWSAKEVGVAYYLSEHIFDNNIEKTTYMYGQLGKLVFTAPSNGILRVASQYGSENCEAKLDGVSVYRPYSTPPAISDGLPVAVIAGQVLRVNWNSPNYPCMFYCRFLPATWP